MARDQKHSGGRLRVKVIGQVLVDNHCQNCAIQSSTKLPGSKVRQSLYKNQVPINNYQSSADNLVMNAWYQNGCWTLHKS